MVRIYAVGSDAGPVVAGETELGVADRADFAVAGGGTSGMICYQGTGAGIAIPGGDDNAGRLIQGAARRTTRALRSGSCSHLTL